MDVLILTVFVSVVFVVGGLLFFMWNVHGGSHDHTERLALLPLDGDTPSAPKPKQSSGVGS